MLKTNNVKTNHQIISIMQEDYGDHNGYTEEMRMNDAQLIVKAPKMRDAITEVLEILNGDGVPNVEWIKKRLATALHDT